MRLGHVGALDGVRAVAIAGVLVYHGYGLPGGLVGVDVFFVLSGFLITTLLLEEHAAKGKINLRAFYGRRARRLLPVAIAGIALYEIEALGTLGHGLNRQALSGVFALFYVENFAHFLHPPVISGLGHYWSLSEEEQFYFLWPSLLVFLLARSAKLKRVAVACVLLAAIVIAHRATLHDTWRLYGPDARADGILIGCALAIARIRGYLVGTPRLWDAVGTVGLCACITDMALMRSGDALTWGIAVVVFSTAAMIAGIIGAPDGRVARLLSLTPIRWLGLISYSLYIWQPLIASQLGLRGTVMLVFSLIVAFGSYKLIEQLFRAPRPAASAIGQGAVERPSPPLRAAGASPR